eukprot:TRINITY_DN6664_c0_g1_i1.p1 TRINITY_DN6664_c0_g1~~TRINITY_DN6664_c0_g1_i1.p1  ORF type:complete len:277 (+),score=27.32 TRINITY_DN6664_c0_g1_i1:29-832(+)
MYLTLLTLGLTLIYLIIKVTQNRYFKKKRSKNTTDFLLDNVILNLKTNATYKEYMNIMLEKNNSYEFPEVDNYHQFQEELYISLGGKLKHKGDYEVIVKTLMYVSNSYYIESLKILPRFLFSFIRMRFNELSTMENTMHMLTLHATSIGGYLSSSYDENFIQMLKKVRIVRENTGYVKGGKILFARVRNPFVGTTICPLSSKHENLVFPPLAKNHNFLNLKDYGNALGVVGVNKKCHMLDDKPLDDYEYMHEKKYWKTIFPHEFMKI